MPAGAGEPEAKRQGPSQSLRLGYGVLQTLALALFEALCIHAGRVETIFRQLEMNSLPIPTALLLEISRWMRSPLGYGPLAVLWVVLLVLAARGALDGALKALMVINGVVVVVVLPYAYLSLRMPIVAIERALEGR